MIRILDRIQDTGETGALAAFAGVALQAMLKDAFFWLFWILVIANIADWFAGRFHARYKCPSQFSRRRSRLGIYEKALALVIVLLVRSLELVMLFSMGISTYGMAASAITAALIYEDIESLDKHRMGMGKSPIPLLSHTLERLRELTGADRRSTDREGIDAPRE